MFTVKESSFEFSLVIEEGERHEDVCDTDGWITVPGMGSWGATFVTVARLHELWDESRATGERASGRYFATPGLVILREPGLDNIIAAVRDMVETELYRFVLVKQVEIDADDQDGDDVQTGRAD